MQNNLIKKWATLGITTLMIGLVFGSAGNAVTPPRSKLRGFPSRGENA